MELKYLEKYFLIYYSFDHSYITKNNSIIFDDIINIWPALQG